MAITKEAKKEVIEALKHIEIGESYVSEEETKRKWFRFGAYDALRAATELINNLPEPQLLEVKENNFFKDNGSVS